MLFKIMDTLHLEWQKNRYFFSNHTRVSIIEADFVFLKIFLTVEIEQEIQFFQTWDHPKKCIWNLHVFLAQSRFFRVTILSHFDVCAKIVDKGRIS